MKRLIAVAFVAFAVAVAANGCHEKKNEPTTPPTTLGDGGTTAEPVHHYPRE